MLTHIVRIGPAWLRKPLLALLFVPTMGEHLINGLCRPADRWRVLDAGFWVLPWLAFTAAWRGAFVPR